MHFISTIVAFLTASSVQATLVKLDIRQTCNLNQAVVSVELNVAAQTIFGGVPNPIPSGQKNALYNQLITHVVSTYPDACVQKALVYGANCLFAGMTPAVTRRDPASIFELEERSWCPWCGILAEVFFGGPVDVVNVIIFVVTEVWEQIQLSKKASTGAQRVLLLDKVADKPYCKNGLCHSAPRRSARG